MAFGEGFWPRKILWLKVSLSCVLWMVTQFWQREAVDMEKIICLLQHVFDLTGLRVSVFTLHSISIGGIVPVKIDDSKRVFVPLSCLIVGNLAGAGTETNSKMTFTLIDSQGSLYYCTQKTKPQELNLGLFNFLDLFGDSLRIVPWDSSPWKKHHFGRTLYHVFPSIEANPKLGCDLLKSLLRMNASH